jgi:signal transduction histidine kinase
VERKRVDEELRQYGAKLKQLVDERTEQLRKANEGLWKEIGERKQVEEALRLRQERLERFTYTVSHELRTPLVTIKGFLGLLEKELHDDGAGAPRESFDRIAAAADRMSDRLSDLLRLMRIDHEDEPMETMSFRTLVDRAAAKLRDELERARVELHGPAGDVVVVGRAHRLLEVIENLLENAARYMGDQPKPVINIDSREEPAGRVFYVRDNGVGIAPEYREKVFELFSQLDAKTDGAGTGLTIVRRVVEAHGGSVWIEPGEAGRGTTVCFTLNGETIRDPRA